MGRERISLGDRVEVLDRAGWRCWFCGTDLMAGNATVTCLTPTARGGTCDRANLQAVCVACSSTKTGKTVEEYRRWLWERGSESARASVALDRVIQDCPSLGRYHREAVSSIAARLALEAPNVVFFGERKPDTMQ